MSAPTAVIVGEQLTVFARSSKGQRMRSDSDKTDGAWVDGIGVN